jgi:transposase-like protein
MALVHVQWPQCHSIDVVQYGQQAPGTQRYRCNNLACPRPMFLLQSQDQGRLPAVKPQSVDMTLPGSGVRDIVRVVRVSSATVINVLKKTRMANLTREQYNSGYSRSALLRKGVKISRSLLHTGP